MKRTLLFLLPLLCLSASAVRLTAYNAVPGQTDSTPWLSACGRTLAPGQQVALSPDLFRKVGGCGTRLRVWRPDTRRWHTYIVWDKTSSRLRNQVDILFPTLSGARAFGVKTGKVAW